MSSWLQRQTSMRRSLRTGHKVDDRIAAKVMAERIAERDRRSAGRRPRPLISDIVGDPPPGRSALDRRKGW